MLHTEVKQVDQYLPQLDWAPLTNKGRPMDKENLKAIEDDYLDAWYVKSIAYKTNTKQGIEDYYTNVYKIDAFGQENLRYQKYMY